MAEPVAIPTDVSIPQRRPPISGRDATLVWVVYIFSLVSWIVTWGSLATVWLGLAWLLSWITAGVISDRRRTPDRNRAIARLWFHIPLGVATFPLGPIIWAAVQNRADRHHEQTELLKMQVTLMREGNRSTS